jgi:hypothetical protein
MSLYGEVGIDMSPRWSNPNNNPCVEMVLPASLRSVQITSIGGGYSNGIEPVYEGFYTRRNRGSINPVTDTLNYNHISDIDSWGQNLDYRFESDTWEDTYE